MNIEYIKYKQSRLYIKMDVILYLEKLKFKSLKLKFEPNL